MGQQGDRCGGRCSCDCNGRKDHGKANSNKKETLEDCNFYVVSGKQASDFEITYNYIVNYMERIYTRGNDITKSLRKLEAADIDKWEHMLQISSNTVDTENIREDKQFELNYKEYYDEYMKRKRSIKENKYKEYNEL